jgi:hypothetical protein
MKTLLLNFWMGFLLFMSPLFPLMLIITLAVIFDTFVGRWYARTQGEVVTSGKTRKGLTVKLVIYLSAIFFSFLIDKYMVNEITRNYVWFDFLFTRFWTAFFVWIEYTSIDEKFKWANGEGITDKILRFVKSLKKPFNAIIDIKNKI